MKSAFKPAFKNAFYLLRAPLDILFAVLAAPSALILRTYRRIGSKRLSLTTRVLKGIGLFPIRNHYYEPLFDDAALSAPLSDDRALPGIDMNPDGQIAFLETLVHAAELKEMRLDERTGDVRRFHLDNDGFESGDAEFLYQFVRAVKPGKIVEIGSGYSTRIAKAALDRNFADTRVHPTHVCIEPYEMAWLEKLGVTVVRRKVEDCEIDWARELKAGDLLFIDSSHVIRPQGDVVTEYLQIIPQLASGVYVHVHDIFTPKDYLRSWIVDEVRLWNEQYILEALLSDSPRYRIVAALNYLQHHHYDALRAVCPYLSPEREPGSFYFRVE